MVEAKLSLMAFRDGSYIIKQRDEEDERVARARARRLKDAEGRSATVEDADVGDENDTNTIWLSALEKGASLLDDLDTSHRAASNELARKRSGRLPLYLNYAAKIMWDYIQRQNGDPRTALRVIRLAASLPNSFRELIGNEI